LLDINALSIPVIESAGIDVTTGLKHSAMDSHHGRNFQGEDEERGAMGQ
jgi:hypothetical protein